MLKVNHAISNDQVIPRIESNIFKDNPQAKFAVGLLATGDQVISGRENEYLGYLNLRANVYGAQTHMVPIDHIREDGTEKDKDDSRSLHFGIIENDKTSQRVVAAMRIIVKRDMNDRPLPIEEFFPNYFNNQPAVGGSVELSRYILRHENLKIQDRLKWPLFGVCLEYGKKHSLDPVYAVIEPGFKKYLQKMKFIDQEIASPVFIPEYNTENLAVKINLQSLEDALMTQQTIGKNDKEARTFSYFGGQSIDNEESVA